MCCSCWGDRNLFTQSHFGDWPSLLGQNAHAFIINLEFKVKPWDKVRVMVGQVVVMVILQEVTVSLYNIPKSDGHMAL